LPAFHPELRRSRYIDIFVEGETNATWTATPNAAWIRVSRASGSFSPAEKHLEDRIEVSLDWNTAPASGDGLVTIECSQAKQAIGVHVHVEPREASGGDSFIEADRIVSIYATHSDARSSGWEVLQGLGHTGTELRTSLDTPSAEFTDGAADGAAIEKAPSATYRFVTTTADDKAMLRAFALPTFPITSENGTRIAVSIDGDRPQLMDFYAPEFSEAWREHAMNNVATETLANLRLKPGKHTLTVYGLDPGVTLDRFEVDFTGAHEGYDPVPETAVQP